MKLTVALLVIVLFLPIATSSQTAPPPELASRVPTGKLADVQSIDGLLLAMYDSISGAAGKRDWNRFRSLFVPEARLTSTVRRAPPRPAVQLLSLEGFISGSDAYFAANPFFETAIHNRVERFGNMAQVFSSYESRKSPSEKPFARGINSVQVLYDGSRWYILSILWDEESPTSPLPADMATSTPH